ncbi:MAG: hypothetical protein IJ968_06995, partial [Clostridia bacterium]|nr:hypothetical protein [Clostridia bacterium]
MNMAATDGKPCCAAVKQMTPEQIWMREPVVQCDEEIKIYEEIFPYILADLEKTECEHGIITEGAAYLPSLMKACAIPVNRYLSITPTKEFQVSHYRQREWVPYVLEGCSDKEKAFENWMERDALFAKAVQQQCLHLEYLSLINNGTMPIEEMMAHIATHFHLQQ